ncbi:DNA-directed RNA polymerase protein [Dioscorea alata]|uniref:DNA-directed RNA polymerase V subunit 5A-like n=3 Tax=Dioscorea TaxID=4672 RepID=A0AB40BIB4_DIOCR|nr:DNA-directed RNA polymerase V subunit 5A-like [Dioscorea cayenensis subsp. rotundata]KAH7679304.1 DNA-directed RNA polymerase protein [Dioscorea alata]KAH7679305.1 DNA-directed RNA polymerase protein [Dioscorea alata]
MEIEGCLNSYVDRGSMESHRFFLARRTLLEMLFDRGYAVSVTQMAMTLSEFRETYGESPDLDRLRIPASLISKPSNKILVIFCGPEKVKLPFIRGIYNQLIQENLTRLILVLQSKATSKARDAIKEIFRFKVETFQITELLVNITKHVLKPKHDVLIEEEKQALLKKYNVEESQLPRMLLTDAIARYYGLEKGQVVKVTYDGELTGNHVSYRCVM